MKLIPMGEYYVWHCDWCDSTNHTLWNRLDGDGLACAACHHLVLTGTPSAPNNYLGASLLLPVPVSFAA